MGAMTVYAATLIGFAGGVKRAECKQSGPAGVGQGRE